MKYLFPFVFLLVISCTTIEKNKAFISGDIEPGSVIIDELSVKTPKQYAVMLDSGSFVYGEVDQISVDVVVNIKEGEKEIRTFDGPGEGIESFMFETTKKSEYTIEVAPFKKDSGKYSIELKVVDPIATIPEKRIDQLLYPYGGNEAPGGVVGVIKDGKLIFSKNYGKANLTHSINFDASTPTNIGSVSKQFTAMAILLLEQEGRLSTEDDIRKHIPEIPDFGDVIKIKNLLNHTTGLWEVYNLMPITGWKGEDKLIRSEILEMIKRQDKLQAKPGEEFNYNNTAFILLAEVVKRTSGTEFPQWVKENIFEPLDMKHSYVRDNPKEIIKNASQGYVIGKSGYDQAGDLDAAYGAGAIYTTVEDLSKWINNFDKATLGGEKLIAKLVSRDTLNNGDTISYGFGISVGELNGLKEYSHGGADIAHRAFISYFPEINSGTIVLSNFAGFPVGKITQELRDGFLGDLFVSEDGEKEEKKSDEHKVDTELLTKYAGKYLLEIAAMVIDIQLENEKLVAITTGQPKYNLIALNDSAFKIPGVDAKIVFIPDEKGKVDKATLVQNGRHELKKIPDYSPGNKELQEFEGQYINNQLETLYTVNAKDSTLVVNHLNLKEIVLEPVEEDSFNGSTNFMGKVDFKRDNNGNIESFSVSNGRTKNIVFVKL